MDEEKYIRKVQCSVVNFIYHGDDYLFLHRGPHKKIDPNKLNGVGGRVEPGENFLEAVTRETEEETGYKITSKQVKLAGAVKLEGGYSEDWVMCFFKTRVNSKEIPIGEDTEDGKLVWINKDKVLDSKYELVDDLNYCFKDLIEGKSIFFMTAQMNEKEEVETVSISK